MSVKKKVFIASSSEAIRKGVYKKIVDALGDDYIVIDWRSIMKSNYCVLDCLIEQSLKVDKAIFIGTGDDMVSGVDKTRGEKIQHRDNVIFELGLFMGTLGKDNCIYLVEEKTLASVMSDYKGVNVFPFNIEKDSYPDKDIMDTLKLEPKLYQSIFPSVALGTIYFDNFIHPILESYIYNNNKLKIEGVSNSYNTFYITILIPNTISSDINSQIKNTLNSLVPSCKEGRIMGKGRPRNVNYYKENGGLVIIDIPSALSGLRSLIDNVLPKSRACEPNDYDSIIEREVRRFVETIKLKFADSPCLNGVDLKCVYEKEFSHIEPKKLPPKIFWTRN
ncbi:MAG: STING domain-containing protein [Rikenellaceae bacterium]